MSISVDIKKKIGSFTLAVKFSTGNGCLGLLGSSGCGKSMTLRCIAGIVTPDEGEIVVGGRTLFSSEGGVNLPPRQRKVGLMFQSYALFPHMTVAANIAAGVPQKHARQDTVARLLSLLQLEGLENRRPSQLSGGQQQRVALARMLAAEPDILLLDEPFSALDGHLRGSIEEEFAQILQAFPGTTIYVSHSIEEVYTFCPTTAVMESGAVVEAGPTQELFLHPSTLTGARLTGCQNLSPLTPSQAGVAAPAWGVSLPDLLPGANTAWVGVRASELFLRSDDGVYCYPVKIAEIRHLPDHDFLTLSTGRGSLICRCSREETQRALRLESMGRLFVHLPPQALLELKNE